MKTSQHAVTLILFVATFGFTACRPFAQQQPDGTKNGGTITVQSKSATVKQSYPGRVKREQFIYVNSPVGGRLSAIAVNYSQLVRQGDALFQVEPPADKEKRGAEASDKLVSIKAPFDGRLSINLPNVPQGKPVRKEATLAYLLTDNTMVVEFDVPDGRGIAWMNEPGNDLRNWRLELILADQAKYPHNGKILGIASKIHNETTDLGFEAEFPNQDKLLRLGGKCTVVVDRVLKDSIIIPRRATFEISQERYVYVVDDDRLAHRRKIVVCDETDEESFVVTMGLKVGDRIVANGIAQVRDGEKVDGL